MKKFAKVLTLIICLILCLSLFGCDNGTTTDQGGNLVPETPGGSTGDNNKPLNLLDYFYETFEDTVSQGILHTKSGNLAPLLDDITFNEPLSFVSIKTKVVVFIETVTLDIGYNGKLTKATYSSFTNYKYDINDIRKVLDIDCSMSSPTTYTFTVNKQYAKDSIIEFWINCDDSFDNETNPLYMDNLRIKLKLK